MYLIICQDDFPVIGYFDDVVEQRLGLRLGKVKSMQRPGTEAIRTKIQPSKPKREITIKLQIVKILREHMGVCRFDFRP